MITAWRRRARGRPWGVVVVSWMALGAAVVVLHLAGGALPLPTVGSPSEWSAWLVGRDPVVVAFAVVRLLALAVAWYGLIVTVAGVCLRLVSAQHLAALVDRLTVVPLRRLASATIAVGLSATALAPTTAGAATTAGATPVPVSSTVGGGPGTTRSGGPPATVTMHRLDIADAGRPGSQEPTTVPGPTATTVPGPTATTPGPTATTPGPTAGRVTTGTWTVAPGQCFWSIAEATLSRAWGRAPTPTEIVPYWNRLIEANRAELADPHNADLVFPGQVFALPTP